VKISLSRLAVGGAVAVVALAAVFHTSLAQFGVGDIFVPADTDSFDPGLPIGAQFPSIRARYQGSEITEIDRFIRDKGAIFIASRSVDW
jgi:hypothetical protein